jgi:HEPN domain-containing protein
MNRAQLQQLAEDRARDAQVLLGAGRWSGAYYLAGYAVECGLKACIAKLTDLHDYPDREFVNKCYTHKIEVLVTLCGLKSHREAESVANPIFGEHWLVVRDWDEKGRYQQWPESQARRLVEAVTETTHGVLPWIRVHW